MIKDNHKVRQWLFNLLAKTEVYTVVDASLSEYEEFGENYHLKIHFGEPIETKGE